MNNFDTLEQRLGVRFADKNILTQAFTHRSYLNENGNAGLTHNERLEFLGDAVLELRVTEYLYERFPDNPEGELTSWRAALVNAKMLSLIAKELDFGEYMLLSKGESKETGKARDIILANAMEAFIGALYLDLGFQIASAFITQHILAKLPIVFKERLFQDGKSQFQEVAQEKTGITPSYTVLKEWGPDHAKHFQVGVYLEKDLVAEGEGTSKQEAEEAAARAALEKNNWMR